MWPSSTFIILRKPTSTFEVEEHSRHIRLPPSQHLFCIIIIFCTIGPFHSPIAQSIIDLPFTIT
jgi:hypothetical protein